MHDRPLGNCFTCTFDEGFAPAAVSTSPPNTGLSFCWSGGGGCISYIATAHRTGTSRRRFAAEVRAANCFLLYMLFLSPMFRYASVAFLATFLASASLAVISGALAVLLALGRHRNKLASGHLLRLSRVFSCFCLVVQAATPRWGCGVVLPPWSYACPIFLICSRRRREQAITGALALVPKHSGRPIAVVFCVQRVRLRLFDNAFVACVRACSRARSLQRVRACWIAPSLQRVRAFHDCCCRRLFHPRVCRSGAVRCWGFMTPALLEPFVPLVVLLDSC
jgi:hypothetical protein